MKFKTTLLFLFSFSVLFSQNNVKLDYLDEAAKGDLNYFEIVKKKKEEIKSYDLSKISNRKAIKQFNRWAYYWKDRVDELGNFPSANLGYFNADILDVNGKIKARDLQYQKSQFNTESWLNVGPQKLPEANGYSSRPQMGRLNTLLRIKHPTDRNQDILFVGAPNGGVWKSTDGGTSWSPKLDFLAGIGVSDIKTTPDATFANYTTKPIYVSTGDYDGRQANSIGVLKSTDGGETFVSTGLSYGLNQQQLLGNLHVIDENNVFVAGKFAVMRTIDGGATWTDSYVPNYNSPIGRGFGRMAVKGTEILVSGYFELAYTNDYNLGIWTTIELENSSNNRQAVTVGEDGSFYVQNKDGQVKKFNSTTRQISNLGSSVPGYNPQGGFNQALLVKNDMMISGAVNGSSSVNNGANWYKSLNGYWENNSSDGSNIHPDIHGIGPLDNDYEFWSVNDGGLIYIDYGNSPSTQRPTITYKSEDVIVTQSYSVAINPSADDDAYVIANQDNDTYSKVNGTWYSVAMGDGIQSAINYNNSNIRYTGNQNGFFVQTDTGFEGQLQGNGKRLTIPGVSFYYPLEINTVNPNILYAGGDEVYKIEDDFVLLMTNLNSGAGNVGEDSAITDIATHGNSIFVAGVNGLRFSSDGGTNWVTKNFNGGTINSVDFDGTNNDILYVSVSGYNAGSKIYKSSDGGTSFSNISGDLPNVVIKEILLKQNEASEILFAATEIGVYYSINGGVNWTRLGSGLPNVDVRDIDIHYTNDKLVAATFGRGLWEISIKNSTLSTDNFNEDKDLLSIFPNPTTNGILNINIKNANDYNYSIYNVVGGVVKSGKLDSSSTIDVSNLAKNIYILRVFNSKENYSTKFIKANN